MKKVQNITVKELRKYLKSKGCEHIRTKGGHEIWDCPNLTRPLTFQTHINPIPQFIILQIIRNLGVNKKDFLNEI